MKDYSYFFLSDMPSWMDVGEWKDSKKYEIEKYIQKIRRLEFGDGIVRIITKSPLSNREMRILESQGFFYEKNIHGHR